MRRVISFLLITMIILNSAIVFAYDIPVTSEFGWRIHPITGQWKFHAGVDLGYEYGTPVNALFAGTIVMAGDYDDGYGNQVLIYHPSIDAYTRYGHMSMVEVTIGEKISEQTIIGYVGSTGNSTGPHLHLEYIVADGNGGYIYTNPLLLWQ